VIPEHLSLAQKGHRIRPRADIHVIISDESRVEFHKVLATAAVTHRERQNGLVSLFDI